MKKKILISCIIIGVFLVIGLIFFNNRTATTITIDINPSIIIELTKEEKVKRIKAVNEDAKDIISNNIKGKELKEAFKMIADKLKEKGYAKENDLLELLVYTEGDLSNDKVKEIIEKTLRDKRIDSYVITIDNVTKEDKKIAKKYNISIAKAAYINAIVKDNSSLKIEDIVKESIKELNDTQTTGNYCIEGYELNGDWCYKEIKRVEAKTGEICPNNYSEYEGKCYELGKSIKTDNYTCSDGFQLSEGNCILEETIDAFGKCSVGEYKDGYCVSKEYIGDATEYCRITPGEDLLYNGRCLGRKPPINGGCLNGDSLINGYCYDTSPSSGYKADLICPDGSFITNPDGTLINEDRKCYKETKTKPESYYCEGNSALNGTKCDSRIIEKAQNIYTCEEGYTIIDNDRCINYNKTTNKENGYVCDNENEKVDGNICIIYDIKEAKHN